MPNKAYAASVVAQVLKRNPKKWIWEGNKSWIVWFVDTFLPKGIWLLVMPRMFGLDRLKKLIAAKKT
jgi:1-acylglycerone phosphate reductase